MENLEMNSSFWKDRIVFVTGHTGFKGSWLCEWLLKMGAQVHGYSLAPNTSPSLFEILRLEQRIVTNTIADIRNISQLKSALKESKSEIVFHMAAQPLVRDSYLDPVGTYEVNIMGTVHMLEALRAATTVRSAIIVTTDKVYENHENNLAFKETDAVGGFDPYSSSKACAELVTSAMRNSFFNMKEYSDHKIGIASARSGNVIGGGDWAVDRLIPDAVRGIVNGKILQIRNPKAIRPWQHVLEPIGGYLLLAEKLYLDGLGHSGAWNFGPQLRDCQSVEQVLNEFYKHWGARFAWEVKDEQKMNPHEAQFLRLDCSKAREILNWKPQWDLNQAIEKTSAWYKEYLHDPASVQNLTKTQIEDYSRLLS